MSQGFCITCAYLSITEKEQDEIRPKQDHLCKKYNIKLYHMRYGVNWHPEIPKCDKCLLVYNYIYSSDIKNSFGEPGVVYVNPGSWIDGPYREEDMAIPNEKLFGFETYSDLHMRKLGERMEYMP